MVARIRRGRVEKDCPFYEIWPAGDGVKTCANVLNTGLFCIVKLPEIEEHWRACPHILKLVEELRGVDKTKILAGGNKVENIRVFIGIWLGGTLLLTVGLVGLMLFVCWFLDRG